VQWRAEQARAQAMSQATGVLENRVVCTLLSILGIATSVRSWLWIAKVRLHRDVFSIDTLFSVIALLISIFIAYRSRFWGDQVVFGALACFGLLSMARATFVPPPAMLVVNVACALLWTIAGIASVIVFVCGFRDSGRND